LADCGRVNLVMALPPGWDGSMPHQVHPFNTKSVIYRVLVWLLPPKCHPRCCGNPKVNRQNFRLPASAG